MARKLSKTEAEKVEWGQQRRYPWDEWTDGSTWELSRGDDFNGAVPQFRSQAYQIAKRRGLEVQVMQDGDKVTIKFSRPVENDNGSHA